MRSFRTSVCIALPQFCHSSDVLTANYGGRKISLITGRMWTTYTPVFKLRTGVILRFPPRATRCNDGVKFGLEEFTPNFISIGARVGM